MLGNNTTEQLKAKFNDILIDYQDIVNSVETKHYVGSRKEIIRLQNKLIHLALLFEMYCESKNIDLKKLLSQIGFYFDASTPIEITKKQYVAYYKSIYIDLNSKIESLNNSLKESVVNKATRDTFIESIVIMKKDGYAVDLKNTTVEEYAYSVKRHRMYCEALLKQQSPNGKQQYH